MQLIDNNKPSATKWQRKKLDEISIIVNGYSFSSQDFSPNNSIKSVKITNVGVGEFIHESSSLLPQEFSDKYNDSKVFKDDIVIALTRSIISSGLKVALVPNEYNEALLNQRVAAIKPDRNQMLGTFLFFYLSTQDVFDYVKKEANTLMQPNLSIKSLKSLLVPLPTLSEQKRIVSIVDEAFEAIDIAIDNTKQNLTNARELFDSYLDSRLFNVVSGKATQTLLCITDLIIDCEHKTAPIQEEGIPSIRTPNIGKGHLIFAGVYRVSEETYELWTRRGKPEPGDLILAREAPAGNVGVVPPGAKVCLGQRTVLIRPNKKIIDSHYLAFLLLHPIVQKRLLDKSTGATVQHVNMKDIRGLSMSELPSIQVQKACVEELEHFKSEANRLENIYQQKLTALNELKQSILHKAFTGELTADKADLMTNIEPEAIAEVL